MCAKSIYFYRKQKNKSIQNHSRLIRNKRFILHNFFKSWHNLSILLKFWQKFGAKNNNNNKVIIKIAYALHARDQKYINNAMHFKNLHFSKKVFLAWTKLFFFQRMRYNCKGLFYCVPKCSRALWSQLQHYESLEGDCVAKNGSAYVFCSVTQVSYAITVSFRTFFVPFGAIFNCEHILLTLNHQLLFLRNILQKVEQQTHQQCSF